MDETKKLLAMFLNQFPVTVEGTPPTAEQRSDAGFAETRYHDAWLTRQREIRACEAAGKSIQISTIATKKLISFFLFILIIFVFPAIPLTETCSGRNLSEMRMKSHIQHQWSTNRPVAQRALKKRKTEHIPDNPAEDPVVIGFVKSQKWPCVAIGPAEEKGEGIYRYLFHSLLVLFSVFTFSNGN